MTAFIRLEKQEFDECSSPLTLSPLKSMGISSLPPKGEGFGKSPFRTAFLCLPLAPLCFPKPEGPRFNPPKPETSSTFTVQNPEDLVPGEVVAVLFVGDAFLIPFSVPARSTPWLVFWCRASSRELNRLGTFVGCNVAPKG